MSIDSIELLLHPVRIRIVTALNAGRTYTTAQLSARMPDVSQATMYRQVAVLAAAGVLEVESEDRSRGPAERRYRLRRERAVVTAEESAAMTLEDHRGLFTAAMGALMGEFNNYLDRRGADPYRDSVAYRQFVLWLSQEELAAFQGQIRTALAGAMELPAARDRAPYLLSTICFPTDAGETGA